jgi:hypothetical protein
MASACVCDDAGGLAFLVDNYSRQGKLRAGELLLMKGQGTPLLSFRPQVSSVFAARLALPLEGAYVRSLNRNCRFLTFYCIA